MKCFNISRKSALNFEKDGIEDFENTYSWISIQEPTEEHISNKYLDSVPNLKIKFYDTEKEIDEKTHTPTEKIAKKIVNFVLKMYAEKRSIVINCAMGVSRSSAICKFCEEMLGYQWPIKYFKEHSDPNLLLFNLMVDYYTNRLPDYYETQSSTNDQ